MTDTDLREENWKGEMRQICTYYSEFGEGTAGYDLTEEQFQKLFDYIEQLILKEREKEREKVIEEIKGKINRSKKIANADKIMQLVYVFRILDSLQSVAEDGEGKK